MIESEKFAIRLQKVIDYYGISASSFADSIGVQRSSISHILSGRNKPSLDFVMKVLDKYPDIELYWLLNGKGTFPKETTIEKNTEATTPSLFDDDKKNKTPTLQELNKKEKTTDIFKNSSISRIVFFYKDGTFEEFKNS